MAYGLRLENRGESIVPLADLAEDTLTLSILAFSWGGNGIGGGGVSAIMAANGVPVADWTRTGSRLDENEPAPGSDGANGAVKNKTKKGSPLWGSVNLGDVINCPDLNGSTPAHAVASLVPAMALARPAAV